MPIPLRPLDKVVEKWVSRTTAAAGDYATAVAAPLRPWKENTLAASGTWKAAVTDAAGRDAFAKAVAKVDTAFWSKRSVELGAPRFPDGVTKSKDIYQSNFAPYYDALGKVELPARGPRGAPINYERVKVIGEALRKKKIG